MRTVASIAWPRAVSVRVRPRRYGRCRRGIGAGVAAVALVVGAAAFGAPATASDVRAAATSDTASVFTVGLTVFDGEPPSDLDDGPGMDLGPSNGVVREGDSVTYVVDIGVGYTPLPEVVIDLPVPRGFTLSAVPEYCVDRSFVDEIGLLCRVGDVEPDRYVTRAVTMIAGASPESETGGVPVAVVVSADGGAVRARSGEVIVRVSARTGECDPYGIPLAGGALSPSGPVTADGRITGMVTSGAAESVTVEGVDQCGHAIVRSVTPVDGHFSFVGLVPGTYRLTVDGRAPVEIALEPGAMTVNGVTF